MRPEAVTDIQSLASADVTTGGRVLTDVALRQFRDDGFLCPVPAVGRARALDLRQRLEAVERRYGGVLPTPMVLKAHLLFPWLDETIRDPRILDPIEDIVGPDIFCWSTRLFIKNPHDGGFLAWHQDLTYWGLDASTNVVTAWLALSPATRISGVTKVVPGTHRKLVRHRKGKKASMLQRGQEIAVDVNENDAVYMELKPGDMSLHHGLIFHASDENQGDDRRIGLAIRYISTNVRPLVGLPRDHVTLVRGNDVYGYYDHETAPLSDLDAAAVEHHRVVCDRYKEIHDLSAKLHPAIVGETA